MHTDEHGFRADPEDEGERLSLLIRVYPCSSVAIAHGEGVARRSCHSCCRVAFSPRGGYKPGGGRRLGPAEVGGASAWGWLAASTSTPSSAPWAGCWAGCS